MAPAAGRFLVLKRWAFSSIPGSKGFAPETTAFFLRVITATPWVSLADFEGTAPV